MTDKRKLLFVVNVDWIFISHRLPIALEAKNAGYKVLVAAKDSGRADEIRKLGIEFIHIPISRSGTNPFVELQVLFCFFKLYRKIKPDIIHHITMKPIIYGSLVARLLRIKTVNAISGLGYVFTEGRDGFVQKLMIYCMRFGFSKKENHLIFQNLDDKNELERKKILNKNLAYSLIKGVGVDLAAYATVTISKRDPITIVMPARMLWDKGVHEFVEAAKILEAKYKGKVLFQLCGRADLENKMGVPVSFLKEIQIEDYLMWIGFHEDMIPVYKEADLVVLPSYREGLPKTLIEACASGLPIVTTNAIGCKDCVEDGKNGLKVPVKSIDVLAEAIEKLILSPELRESMGEYSRNKAIQEFDQKDVIAKHLEIYTSFMD